MRCLWSPATNPTQLNNPATRRVCEIGTSARRAEIELRHNDDAGTSARGALRFRRQRRGEGSRDLWGLEEQRVREIGRNRAREKPATMVSKRRAGKFHKFLETEIEFGRKLRPVFENWSQLETEIRDQKSFRSLIETKVSSWSQILVSLLGPGFKF